RREVRAHLGGPAGAPPPRRSSRSRRDGGQDVVPQMEHRALGSRHAADGGRGRRAEDRGAEEVKVFAVEGEGGLTPGASHETRNSAWGLGLSNLVFLLDWNDFGIDVNAVSSVVHGG